MPHPLETMHPVIAPLAAACSSLGGVLVSARSMILPLSTCSWGTARIAYDRRLALALGCPEAYVNVGVRFRLAFPHRPEYGWIVEAGHDESDFYDGPAWDSQPATVAPGVTDPLLARALAWPADKRVRG